MKKKMGEGELSTVPTNVVSSSYTSPPNPGLTEGARDRLPLWETEMDEESCLVRFARTTVTADVIWRLNKSSNQRPGKNMFFPKGRKRRYNEGRLLCTRFEE